MLYRLTVDVAWLSGIKKDGKSKTKAVKALKAVKRSTWRQSRKPRYSTVFHRPKTLKEPRKPKYPRLRYAIWQTDSHRDLLASVQLPISVVWQCILGRV